MASIAKVTMVESVERSIRNAKHLRAVNTAAVNALRMLAVRMDRLADSEWEDEKGRLDNVTVPTFLKYCQALGLVEFAESAAPATSSRRAPVDELADFVARQGKPRRSG